MRRSHWKARDFHDLKNIRNLREQQQSGIWGLSHDLFQVRTGQPALADGRGDHDITDKGPGEEPQAEPSPTAEPR